MVLSHLKKQNDYTYTDSLPTGMRPEIFSLNALEKCYNSIISRNSTEYLTYFFLRKDIYKIQNFNFKKNYKNQNRLNISVDYNQDLNLVKKIIKFYKGNIYLERNTIEFEMVENPIDLTRVMSLDGTSSKRRKSIWVKTTPKCSSNRSKF